MHRDDDLLRAAQVSLGRLGVVYAMVVATVPRFGLHESRVAITWSAAVTRLADAEFMGVHRAVSLLVSRYQRRDGDRDCWLTTRDEISTAPARFRAHRFAWTASRGLSLIRVGRCRPADVVVGVVADRVNRCGGSALTRSFVRTVLTYSQRPRERTGVGFALMTDPPWAFDFCRGTSLEVFLDADRDDVLAMVESLLLKAIEAQAGRGQAIIGWVPLRFTGPSRATLAMQRWPRTLAIKIAVLRGVAGSVELLAELERLAIGQGATVHWGQFRSDLTPADHVVTLR